MSSSFMSLAGGVSPRHTSPSFFQSGGDYYYDQDHSTPHASELPDLQLLYHHLFFSGVQNPVPWSLRIFSENSTPVLVADSLSDLIHQVKLLNYEIFQFSATAAHSMQQFRQNLEATPPPSRTTFTTVQSVLGQPLFELLDHYYRQQLVNDHDPILLVRVCLEASLVLLCTQTIDVEIGSTPLGSSYWQKDDEFTLYCLIEAIVGILCIAGVSNTRDLITRDAYRLSHIVRICLALKTSFQKRTDLRPAFIESGRRYDESVMVSTIPNEIVDCRVLCTTGLGIFQQNEDLGSTIIRSQRRARIFPILSPKVELDTEERTFLLRNV